MPVCIYRDWAAERVDLRIAVQQHCTKSKARHLSLVLTAWHAEAARSAHIARTIKQHAQHMQAHALARWRESARSSREALWQSEVLAQRRRRDLLRSAMAGWRHVRSRRDAGRAALLRAAVSIERVCQASAFKWVQRHLLVATCPLPHMLTHIMMAC